MAVSVTYMVMADSKDEVVERLARLCEAFGLEPLGRPMQPVGRADRWLARATEVERRSLNPA